MGRRSYRECFHGDHPQARHRFGTSLLQLPLVGGASTPGYALVKAVKPGDIVVHYYSKEEQIVGVSLATDELEPATIFWVARGTSARLAGEEARWLPGIRVPLGHYTALKEPISLTEVRKHQEPLLSIRGEIVQRGQGPVHFPWIPYGEEGPIRPAQTYVAKLPQAAVDLLPDLRDLVDLVGGYQVGNVIIQPESDRAEEEVAQIGGKSRLARGQGHQLDQAARSAIEAHAMNMAIEHFEAIGEVEDVHGTSSFDLRCATDGIEKHIEVKGTTSLGEQVVLTRNEVEHAKTHPDTALFIVHNISVLRDTDGSVSTSGGQVKLFDPWTVGDGTLIPIAFRYEVPHIP